MRTTVLGLPLSMPLLLAPVGSCRLFYPRGEEVAARAAGEAGTAYILSTLSGCRLEDVAAASSGPVLYQLYLLGGREVASATIERARKAGYRALVVTIDTPVSGLRERDLRNGVTALLKRRLGPMLPYVGEILALPRWLAAFLMDGGLMSFPDYALPGQPPMPYADVGTALEQSVVSWPDLRWIREQWKGPIVVKSVHTAEDARRGVDYGAEAIVVSNHGGRQLDGVAPTLRVLARGGGCRRRAHRGAARRWDPSRRRRDQGAVPGERAPGSPGARTPTGWEPPAAPGSRGRSRSCAATSCER
jgi:L-lactate dehydrogenase (cytochrome)